MISALKNKRKAVRLKIVRLIGSNWGRLQDGSRKDNGNDQSKFRNVLPFDLLWVPPWGLYFVMKRLLFFITILIPGIAGAQDNPWADLRTKPAYVTQFDRQLNRAVQLGQLEQLERQKVRDDFEPFEGLFPHRNDTSIGRAIVRAGENSAVEYRMKQKVNSPFKNLGQ